MYQLPAKVWSGHTFMYCACALFQMTVCTNATISLLLHFPNCKPHCTHMVYVTHFFMHLHCSKRTLLAHNSTDGIACCIHSLSESNTTEKNSSIFITFCGFLCQAQSN